MDQSVLLQVVLLGLVLGGMVLYILIGRFRNKRLAAKAGAESYHWKPEQDYDVVLQENSSMTPTWPVLKKRSSAKN